VVHHDDRPQAFSSAEGVSARRSVEGEWWLQVLPASRRSDQLDLSDITDDVANALDDLGQARADGLVVPVTL
jgi:hypothetical protein